MEAEPEVVILHLEGNIDLATAPILADTIAAAFRQHQRVVVDLADVAFLDASGLKVLYRAALDHVGTFAVAVSKMRIRRLFEVVRFTEVVPLAGSVTSALEYLSELTQFSVLSRRRGEPRMDQHEDEEVLLAVARSQARKVLEGQGYRFRRQLDDARYQLVNRRGRVVHEMDTLRELEVWAIAFATGRRGLPLNPEEIARKVVVLHHNGYADEKIARLVQKSVAYVHDVLRAFRITDG
jgi:anti-anti-sigma factor